jgi:rRNA maturation endonuclease Nob1
MIRQSLEALVGRISDSLFNNVMEITTDDVRVNRILFRQRTSFDSVIGRAKVALDLCLSCMETCLCCGKADFFSEENYCVSCGSRLKRKVG